MALKILCTSLILSIVILVSATRPAADIPKAAGYWNNQYNESRSNDLFGAAFLQALGQRSRMPKRRD